MSDVTLLYGIGAAKAGTSWLHAWLSTHPECHLRAVKEVHYFDTLGPEGQGWRKRVPKGRIKALKARRAGARPRRRAEIGRKIGDFYDWRRMMQGPGGVRAYVDYLTAGRSGRRLVGDITPAYATLPAERLAEMASLMPDTRFVFLMRDPLDRLWSNLRMSALRETGGGPAYGRRAHRLMERFLAGHHPGAAARSDYAGTLARLRAAVPESRAFIGFFEDLFTPEAISRLTRFLGLAPHPAPLARRVHQGRALPMSPRQRRAALAALAPQYAHVAETVPGPLPARWLAHMKEVA